LIVATVVDLNDNNRLLPLEEEGPLDAKEDGSTHIRPTLFIIIWVHLFDCAMNDFVQNLLSICHESETRKQKHR
jgi:hypothetical protein